MIALVDNIPLSNAALVRAMLRIKRGKAIQYTFDYNDLLEITTLADRQLDAWQLEDESRIDCVVTAHSGALGSRDGKRYGYSSVVSSVTKLKRTKDGWVVIFYDLEEVPPTDERRVTLKMPWEGKKSPAWDITNVCRARAQTWSAYVD